MDLNNFTVHATNEGETDLDCNRCRGNAQFVASSEGWLGMVSQLPHPITLTALLKAATKHEFEVHRGS